MSCGDNFYMDFLPAEATIEYAGEPRHLKFPSALQLFAALKHLASESNYLFIQTLRHLKPIDYVVDVGANTGSTVLLFHLAFPEARIFGIEPATVNYECLRHNVEGLTGITTVRKAASDKRGIVEIALPTMGQRPDTAYKQGNSGMFSLYGKDNRHRETVEADTLDNMVQDGVDFLKLDIEGAEHLALRGAKRMLNRDRPFILIEANPKNWEMAGQSREYYVNFFACLNYIAVARYIGDVLLLPHEYEDRYKALAL